MADPVWLRDLSDSGAPSALTHSALTLIGCPAAPLAVSYAHRTSQLGTKFSEMHKTIENCYEQQRIDIVDCLYCGFGALRKQHC